MALSTRYEPGAFEADIYQAWEEGGYFKNDINSKKPPYTIVIPPPNITGRLHLGHALNNTVQDILIRYKRMDGFDALWVPGTDHAGIATQAVVKKKLAAQGKNFRDLGREKFIEEIWAWKNEFGSLILGQLKRLGCSCNWEMLRFTMDEGLNKAVCTAFKKLYDQGLIYKGEYLVNWCPSDRTALSNDEVIHKEVDGFFWHFKYPLSDGTGEVIIATTRPETMLGDTAVAVNPGDERFKHLIGKEISLPLTDRKIPIIGDSYVKIDEGTGCLKVTPAHDPNDFEIGKRHKLEMLSILDEAAVMNENCPEKYQGLDRYECRKVLVADMKAAGLLVKVEPHKHNVGHGERSGVPVESRLSMQWFVKMKPLAEKALKASQEGKVKMYPARWNKVLQAWLEGIHDWCISRQIWWGHRIPVWTHKETGEILVDIETPEQVKKNPENWEQETDVLDTWFSSMLWPFSVLGWPEKTEELARYYPTSLLSTGGDIIFLWVSRMIMMGLEQMEDIPFSDVYFHGMICDYKGETMSKHKGNGIDPSHIMDGATVKELEGPLQEARPHDFDERLKMLRENFSDGFQGVGADALRFTLLMLTTEGQQINLSLSKFDEIGKKFMNKLWNACRFNLMNLEEADGKDKAFSIADLKFEDRWILSRMQESIQLVREGLDKYQFNQVATALYRLTWNDYCDWYLEFSKPRLYGTDKDDRLLVQRVLTHLTATLLKLLHPFIPFLTEHLWTAMRDMVKDKGLDVLGDDFSQALIISEYPKVNKEFLDTGVSEQMEMIQELIRETRNLRAKSGIKDREPLKALVICTGAISKSVLPENASLIKNIAFLEELEFTETRPEGFSAAVGRGFELFLDLSAFVNWAEEIKRLEKELLRLEKGIKAVQGKLGNKKFMENAPPAIREAEEKKFSELKGQVEKMEKALGEAKGKV